MVVRPTPFSPAATFLSTISAVKLSESLPIAQMTRRSSGESALATVTAPAGVLASAAGPSTLTPARISAARRARAAASSGRLTGLPPARLRSTPSAASGAHSRPAKPGFQSGPARRRSKRLPSPSTRPVTRRMPAAFTSRARRSTVATGVTNALRANAAVASIGSPSPIEVEVAAQHARRHRGAPGDARLEHVRARRAGRARRTRSRASRWRPGRAASSRDARTRRRRPRRGR